MTPARFFAVMAVVCVAAGCGPIMHDDAVREAAARELDCPARDLTLEVIGEARYRVGCRDQRARYACTTGQMNPVCLRMGAIERVPSSGGEAAPEPTNTPTRDPEDAVRIAVLAERERILTCAGESRVAVVALVTEDGTVDVSLQGPLAGSPQEGCVRAALRALRVEGPAVGPVIVLVELD